MQVNAVIRPASAIAPHVEVTVTDPPASAVSVTVTRRAQGRDFLTRGFVDLGTDSTLFVRDIECGFDVDTVYTAVAVNAAGIVVATAVSQTVRLLSTRGGVITIHDPIRPATELTLTLARSAIQGGVRSTNASTVAIPGQSVPIGVPSVRSGMTGIAFDVITFTDADAEKLDAMFGGYDSTTASGIVCIRPSSDVPPIVPRTFFALVAEPRPVFFNAHQGGHSTVWGLTATEVRPPSPALLEPIVTWADLAAYWAAHGGWAGFNAGNTNGIGVTRDLRPMGAAA